MVHEKRSVFKAPEPHIVSVETSTSIVEQSMTGHQAMSKDKSLARIKNKYHIGEAVPVTQTVEKPIKDIAQ